jgi:hypothetical protein
MSRRRLLILGWLIVLALSALLPLSAIFHGVVHVGSGTMTIHSRLSRPLVSIGSDVKLKRGTDSTVVVILGSLYIQGKANGDVVTAGGHVYLGSQSEVRGDVLSLLGGIFSSTAFDWASRLASPYYSSAPA